MSAHRAASWKSAQVRAIVLVAAFAAQAPFASSAHAEVDIKFPSGAPAAMLHFPDGWTVAAKLDGVDATIGEGALHLAIRYVVGVDRESAIRGANQAPSRAGLAINGSSRRSSSLWFERRDAIRVAEDALSAKGAQEILIVIVPMAGRGRFVTFALWGAGDALETVGNDMQMIAQSLRAVP